MEPAYPGIQKSGKELIFIYQELHFFDENISVEEVAVVERTKKDSFDFVFYFTDDKDFEKLENYYIALILYPENVSTIEFEKDRKRSLTSKNIKCKLAQDVKYLAVVLSDFRILGKKMKSGKT